MDAQREWSSGSRVSGVTLEGKKPRETKEILLYFHRHVVRCQAMYLQLQRKEENSFLTLIKNLSGIIFAR